MKYIRKGAMVLPDKCDSRTFANPSTSSMWGLAREYFDSWSKMVVVENWVVDETRIATVNPESSLAFICLAQEVEVSIYGIKKIVNSFWVLKEDIETI